MSAERTGPAWPKRIYRSRCGRGLRPGDQLLVIAERDDYRSRRARGSAINQLIYAVGGRDSPNVLAISERHTP